MPNRQVQACEQFGVQTVHIGGRKHKFKRLRIRCCGDHDKRWITCEKAAGKTPEMAGFKGFPALTTGIGSIRGDVGKNEMECGCKSVSPIHRVRVTTIKILKGNGKRQLWRTIV